MASGMFVSSFPISLRDRSRLALDLVQGTIDEVGIMRLTSLISCTALGKLTGPLLQGTCSTHLIAHLIIIIIMVSSSQLDTLSHIESQGGQGTFWHRIGSAKYGLAVTEQSTSAVGDWGC